MQLKNRYLLMPLAIFLIIYVLPLGARDLFIQDETRYGEIPREMMASGDWLVPHLNGLRYFEKPPMGYWVHAGSILLLGKNNFAVRLPSAMAVGLSALLIYVLMGHGYVNGGKEKGWQAALAALLFLTCFEVMGVGTFAVLDSLFSFFLTASITAFYFASEASRGSTREKQFLLLSGISCGLAFLTKGFLALAVPVLALAPYLIWQRRYRDFWRMIWLPLLAAMLVTLPLGLLIHLREPDFWRFFFWNEHIRRFLADNAQHKESFLFFLLVAPIGFMPWTFVSPAAIAGIRKHIDGRSPHGRLLRLSLCWLVLPFLFFSASNGKLVTYILPCFPPFAILLAFGLLDGLDKGKNKKAFQWGVLIAAILFGLILLSFIYFQRFGYKGFYPYSQPWKWLMAINGLISFILFCLLAFRSQRGRDKVLLFGLAPLLLSFAAHFIMPDPVIEAKAPSLLLERHKQEIGQEAVIISDETTIGAVCWYFQRSDVFLLEGAGELAYGLAREDAAGRLLNMKSAVQMINRNRGKTVLVARVNSIRRWRDYLPEPTFQDDSSVKGYVYWRY